MVGSISDQTYTGSQITPDVTVTDGSTTLTKDIDYTVAYGTNALDEGEFINDNHGMLVSGKRLSEQSTNSKMANIIL